MKHYSFQIYCFISKMVNIYIFPKLVKIFKYKLINKYTYIYTSIIAKKIILIFKSFFDI